MTESHQEAKRTPENESEVVGTKRELSQSEVPVPDKRPKFPFYTNKYYLNVPRVARVNGGTQITAWHCNGLAVECLGEGHPVLKKKITEVSFETGKASRNGSSRLDAVNPKGKKKRGGLLVKPETAIAIVTLDGGDRYKVHANTAGQLIELNTKLLTQPELLQTSRDADGYFGIIQPNKEGTDTLTKAAAENNLTPTFQVASE
eukprot:TRINITY_DN17167_c0_g1_i1.p1 TRINITY_DN17167_c0_g1~~TRINITY_DN17167_c0_g1_i1.p1  ORF type:complete len:222 (+),score=46.18 TRINITY_DN17167_c0_g1_i1:59-667(+)